MTDTHLVEPASPGTGGPAAGPTGVAAWARRSFRASGPRLGPRRLLTERLVP